MASKIAVISASKTYMADILDKNTLIFTFYGWLEAKWYKQSDKNMVWFDSEGWTLKMASKMAVS